MERKGLRYTLLGLAALMATASAVTGVFAAGTQAVNYSGNISYTATSNVYATVEVFVNDATTAASTITFEGNEATDAKKSPVIDLSTYLKFVDNSGSKDLKVSFNIKNTYNGAAAINKLSATITETNTALTNITENKTAETLTLDKGIAGSIIYSYKITDFDIDAELNSSWAVALSASK